MARIDLRNNGYHDSTDTIRNNVAIDSMKSLVTVPYRSVDDTSRLILMVVIDSKRALSRAEICKKIKRKKAPGIVKLIEQLVQDELLIRHQHTRANGVVMFSYSAGRRIDTYGNILPDWVE